MEISSGMAAQQALLRQEVTLNVMKQAAEQQQSVVSLIESVAASAKGNNVNTSA